MPIDRESQMSRFQSLFRGRLRSVGLIATAGVAALALAGCTTITQDSESKILSFWERPSDQIVWTWASPSCNQDVNGNGNAGDIEDRALCAFFVTRGTFCNNLRGEPALICNAATDPNGPTDVPGVPRWLSFSNAANGFVASGGDCLAVRYGAFGDIRRWVVRDSAHPGCINP
jgi:hypothetical protein